MSFSPVQLIIISHVIVSEKHDEIFLEFAQAGNYNHFLFDWNE